MKRMEIASMPNQIQELIESGVRLSMPLSDNADSVSLRYDNTWSLYYTYDPNGVGEQEFERFDEAFAEFNRVSGIK